MAELTDSFRVIAINLLGYGSTPHWTSSRLQSLDDQADLIDLLTSDLSEPINIVGHSFGGSVAMCAAMRLGKRVDKLVLLEPNPFNLLNDNGRYEAYTEACRLRDIVKTHGSANQWIVAAEKFADYWGGPGTWAATPTDRRETFAQAIKPNFHEWDAVMNAGFDLALLGHRLPERTLVVSDPNTVRPIKEIVELMRESCPWQFETISEGGHMAPLTRPELVNPIVRRFLSA